MSVLADFEAAIADDPIDLARAALVIARIEYPQLDPGPRSRCSTGSASAHRRGWCPRRPSVERVARLNAFLFDEERFAGNRAHYDDFRNSLLNVVLDRRLGIPITLALVYMEVARRAGLDVEGVAFPGHFLMRVPLGARDRPFAGARCSIRSPAAPSWTRPGAGGCSARTSASSARNVPFDRALLRPCSTRQHAGADAEQPEAHLRGAAIVPASAVVTDLLLAVDPMLHTERRDRGLLAYHLDDYAGALRDLEDYLRLNSWSATSEREEHDQIWEHVKTLRRRVAALN